MITIELVGMKSDLPSQVNNAYDLCAMKDGDCRIYLCDSDNKLYSFTKTYTGDIIENVYEASVKVDDLIDSLELD